VQLGSDRRLRTIYDTNMRTARSAGQWDRIQRTKRAMPYLLYTLGPSREHRAEHLKWANLCLPDDPFWQTHIGPNGWGCKCGVRRSANTSTISCRKMASRATAAARRQRTAYRPCYPPDRTGPHRSAARQTGEVGEQAHRRRGDGAGRIDPGWDYNPGTRRQAELERQLAAKQSAFDSDNLNEAVIRLKRAQRLTGICGTMIL
jgi:hypothetical protein